MRSQVRTILMTLLTGAVFGLVALMLIECCGSASALATFRAPSVLAGCRRGSRARALYTIAGDRMPAWARRRLIGVLAGMATIPAVAFLLKISPRRSRLRSAGAAGSSRRSSSSAPRAARRSRRGLACRRHSWPPWDGRGARRRGEHADCGRGDGDGSAPESEGVYAALATVTAFLIVGHRSVYASQKLGLSKSAGLDIDLGGPIGDVDRSAVRIRKGSLTERLHLLGRGGATEESKKNR